MPGHFGVEKSVEMIKRRYYWPMRIETNNLLQETASSETDEDIDDIRAEDSSGGLLPAMCCVQTEQSS